MPRQGRVVPTTAALCLLAPSLLIGAVSFGLRGHGQGTLAPLPEGAGLDYALRRNSFAPLTDRFVGGVLGRQPLAVDATTIHRSAPVVDRGATPISIEHPFTNDDFSKAYVVPSVPFTARTNTATATRETGSEPSDCSPVGGTAWYRFTPRTDLRLIASTIGSDYATALAVFSGGSAETLEGCARDAQGNSLVAFRATEGVTYDFQITGPVNGGPLVFNLLADGATTRASVSSDGAEADGSVIGSWMSADGRYVAYLSFGNHTENVSVSSRGCYVGGLGGLFFQHSVMIGSETHNPVCPVYTYIRDRATHQIVFAAEGLQATALSASGRYLAGLTYELPDDEPHVIRVDRVTHRTERISVSTSGGQEDGGSYGWLGVSANGRFVGFSSYSSNLVDGDTNQINDVFVRDVWSGRTARVSVSSEGAQANTAGSKSRCVLNANNPCDGGSHFLGMSSNGRWIAFRSAASNLVPNDTNGAMDVFVHDRVTRKTERVSVSSTGVQGNNDTLLATFGVGQAISDDGRFVLFNSYADNLVPHDTNGTSDMFVRDRALGTTVRVSVSSDDEEARGGTNLSDRGIDEASFALSPDGRYAAFESRASNLAPGDTNGVSDVFVRDVVTGVTTLMSVASDGKQGNDFSWRPSISSDGRFVHFVSSSTNLVPEDRNESDDVFVHELAAPGRSLSDWY